MRAARLGVALETLEVTVDSDSESARDSRLDENVGAGQQAVRTDGEDSRQRGCADAARDRVVGRGALAGRMHVRNTPACSLDIEVI
jgi:hypothetical protein